MNFKSLLALFGGKQKSCKKSKSSRKYQDVAPSGMVRNGYKMEPRLVFVQERQRCNSFTTVSDSSSEPCTSASVGGADVEELLPMPWDGRTVAEDNGMLLPSDVMLLVLAYTPIQHYSQCALVCGNWAMLAQEAALRNLQEARRLVAQGVAHMANSNVPHPSLELFGQAITLYPKFADASLWMAKGLFIEGQEPAAVRCLEAAVRQRPPTVDRLKLQACLNCAEHNDVKASHLLEAALQSAPTDSTIHYELGFSYHSLLKFPQAVRCYTRALELRYERTFVLLANRANCFFRMGKVDEAMQDVERSLAINKHYELALRTRALVNAQLGKPDLVYRDYSTIIDHSANRKARSDAYCSRAFCFGDMNEADLRKAQEADPTNPEPMRCKTSILLARGRVSDAIAELSHWIEANPRHRDIHIQFAFRAELAASLHDLPQAMEDYRHAIRALLRAPSGPHATHRHASDRLLSYRERLRNLSEHHRLTAAPAGQR
eukprot:EG_transcript_3596